MILPSLFFSADIPADKPVFRRRDSIITRAHYRSHTAALAQTLARTGANTAAILTEDNYHFAVALMAALHAGLDVILPGNLKNSTAASLQAEGGTIISDTKVAEVISSCEQEECSAPLPPFDSSAANVWFYTSGSSGEPKRIHRTFANLEAELQQLAGVLPEGEAVKTYSTSPFHHAYGIIFGFLLPLSRGILSDTSPFLSPADFLSRVDALTPNGELAWIVTSPTFIRVWADNPDVCTLTHRPLRIQSAGAPLPQDAVARLYELTRAEFFEIFGSSETGVTAHRDPRATHEWTPFPDVRITPAEEGGMWIDTPCVPPGDRARPGDNAQLLPNGNFLLLPRADNVVKIADKRISLAEIEQYVESSDLVKQAVVLKLDGKTRPILAVVLTPTPEGWEILRRQGRSPYRRVLISHLAQHLQTIFIPKKWRILGSIPTNTRGKTDRATLSALFNSKDYMPILSVSDQSDTHLVARALYLRDAAWVAGHFPEHPITPGVVILRTISALTEQHWGCTIRYIQRLKFNAEVSPGDEIFFILERKDSSINILLSRTPDGKTVTGKGTCRLSPLQQH